MIDVAESQSLLRTLIIASRPKTLLASLSPVIIGVSLAYSKKPNLNLSFFLTISLIIFCAFLIQILSNFVNDLWDFYKGSDTNERIGPTRVVQAGMIKPEKMKKIIFLLTFLIILCGSILVAKGGLVILAIGLLSILGAYIYTAGPYPLAHNGLGELFVIIFFGPIPIFGTYFLLNNEISPLTLLLGLPIGIIASAILQVNNIRDYKEDSKSGKKTLAVKLGLTIALKIFKLSMTLSILLTLLCLFLLKTEMGILLVAIFYPIALILSKQLQTLSLGQEFNDFLPKISIYLFIFSLSLSTLILIQ
jgi:1,4-dihydroxy-2-naphthoate octaprenyltransferase